jgi:hypothetical protein
MLAALCRTAPAAALGLGLLALSGCATVAWPPPPGSCIWAHIGRGKGAPWVYELDGARVSREHVEKLVGDTPEGRELVRRSHGRDAVGLPLVFAGLPTLYAPLFAAGFTSKPVYALLGLPGLAMLVTGVVLAVTEEIPLRRAIVDFNARVARDHACPMAPAWLLPRPAAPPRVVPVEEVLHPRYGPPPFGG